MLPLRANPFDDWTKNAHARTMRARAGIAGRKPVLSGQGRLSDAEIALVTQELLRRKAVGEFAGVWCDEGIFRVAYELAGERVRLSRAELNAILMLRDVRQNQEIP